jgi:hypothetical protein
VILGYVVLPIGCIDRTLANYEISSKSLVLTRDFL